MLCYWLIIILKSSSCIVQVIWASLIAETVLWISIQLILTLIKIVATAALGIKPISIVVISTKGLISVLVAVIALILIRARVQIWCYLIVRIGQIILIVWKHIILILIAHASELLTCLQKIYCWISLLCTFEIKSCYQESSDFFHFCFVCLKLFNRYIKERENSFLYLSHISYSFLHSLIDLFSHFERYYINL